MEGGPGHIVLHDDLPCAFKHPLSCGEWFAMGNYFGIWFKFKFMQSCIVCAMDVRHSS